MKELNADKLLQVRGGIGDGGNGGPDIDVTEGEGTEQ